MTEDMRPKQAFDLETVYDEEIAPLMTKIIDICKQHKLPMFATFLFANDPEGDDGLCTTNLMFKERPIPLELLRLEPTLRPGRPTMRMRVTNRDGKVVEETIVLGGGNER